MCIRDRPCFLCPDLPCLCCRWKKTPPFFSQPGIRTERISVSRGNVTATRHLEKRSPFVGHRVASPGYGQTRRFLCSSPNFTNACCPRPFQNLVPRVKSSLTTKSGTPTARRTNHAENKRAVSQRTLSQEELRATKAEAEEQQLGHYFGAVARCILWNLVPNTGKEEWRLQN